MKHRVLVVEDNEVNRELLCDWLQIEGLETTSAETLEQAYLALEGEAPAMIFLDVQLGNEDGLALAERVRANPKWAHLPVIAVTAHAMLTDKERVLRAGCNACVAKPIDFKALRKYLQEFIGVSKDSPS